jgi:hypothetical protein
MSVNYGSWLSDTVASAKSKYASASKAVSEKKTAYCEPKVIDAVDRAIYKMYKAQKQVTTNQLLKMKISAKAATGCSADTIARFDKFIKASEDTGDVLKFTGLDEKGELEIMDTKGAVEIVDANGQEEPAPSA